MLFPKFQAFLYALIHTAVRSLRSDSEIGFNRRVEKKKKKEREGKEKREGKEEKRRGKKDAKKGVLVKVCCHLNGGVDDFATLGLGVQPHIMMNT